MPWNSLHGELVVEFDRLDYSWIPLYLLKCKYMKRMWSAKAQRDVLSTLLVSSCVSLVLLIIGILASKVGDYGFVGICFSLDTLITSRLA